MIGVDTNVLIQVFIDDDPDQTTAARQLVAGAAPGGLLISIIVLVEFVWTLRAIFKVDTISDYQARTRVLQKT